MLACFGNGETCECIYCGKTLTRKTLQADRIIAGGSYRHSNLVPACGPCNARRGNIPFEQFKAECDATTT